MKKLLLISILSLIILSWCQKNNISDDTCSLTDQYACTEASSSIDTAKIILQSLKDKDIDTLSTFIDSNEWIRFTPYSYIDISNNIIIKDIKTEYENTGKIILRWHYDWTWDPINLNTQDYFNKFVYNTDYISLWEVIENKVTQRWNSINNITEIYSWAYIIEFYISWFDPQYEWMDRKSLTLVLKEKDNKRYLIWIINWQWTI